MEPANIKSVPPDDAQLEAWYRTNISSPSLPDDGFSRKVLAALPPPARSRRAKRQIFILTGLVVGAAVALVGAMFASAGSIPNDLSAFEFQFTNACYQIATPAFGWALGVTLLSLVIAFPQQLLRRLRYWAKNGATGFRLA